ncbi:uncharacterized protein LOC126849580 [Cataglyphis hispanica]|uniref:uncharacterized protein LOC126849580 n=1 Tax=Cataglyphis hispanica TaxID=1086592 RepID=UPI00217FB452|nr:uncharacterized protein LOC126849580 [Cataglyphis hispanica]
MAKNIEDSYVAFALNSLLSEAHSSLPKANKESQKRPVSQDIPYVTTNSPHSKSDESINSHSTSASESTISLTDNIRYNRYLVNNAGSFYVHMQHILNSNSPLHQTWLTTDKNFSIKDYIIRQDGSSNKSGAFDASKNQLDDENIPDSYVGFFIYSPFSHLQFLFKTYLFSSIFTAEALAILHNLEYILTNSISKSVIFTNSKSVIEALLSINLAHSLNHIIFVIKQKLYEIKSVEFENSIVWILAHSGILGNETADYLTKKAISKGQISPKFFPHSDFYSISRKKYNDDTVKFLKNQGNQVKVKIPLAHMDHLDKTQTTSFGVAHYTHKESCF